MTRKLKTLGLGLLAAFALSAVSASAASADEITSDTQTEVTHLTGVSHDNVFEIPSEKQRFECTTSKFSGTFSGAATDEVTVHPTYNGTIGVTPHTTHCDSSSGTVVVDTNGCDYKLTGETNVEHNGKEAEVHIECDQPGEEIEITGSSGCTVDVPAQTPTQGGVRYTNDGNAIIVDATATGIEWTAHGFICAFGGIATEGHDAIYTGSVTVQGYEDAAHTKEVNLDINET